MFILRSTHRALVKSLEDRLFITTAFYESKERQYQDQIKDLHKLVFPESAQTPNPMVMEADSVLSGSEKPVSVSEEEHNKVLEQAREIDLLFSGNYSEDLLA